MFRQAALPRSLTASRTRSRKLGSRILLDELKPCEILPNEAKLVRELGASRTVVCEAVKSLAAKGLLEACVRTGTRVLEPIHWNLLDLEVLAASHRDAEIAIWSGLVRTWRSCCRARANSWNANSPARRLTGRKSRRRWRAEAAYD